MVERQQPVRGDQLQRQRARAATLFAFVGHHPRYAKRTIGTSDDALKAHAANWKIYTDHAKQNGKLADRSKWRIVTFAHVAETREKARADMAYGLKDFCKYFTDVATFPIVPPDIKDPIEFLTSSGLACIGTPDDCIRHFERLWKGSNGGFGGVLLLAHNWADWPATKRSYELMARYVHPHFQRQSNTLRVASYDDAKAEYDAIVFGDPYCKNDDAVRLAEPLDNLSTWTPAVTGNVIVHTFDSIDHANEGANSAGAMALTKRGIAFAAAHFDHIT